MGEMPKVGQVEKRWWCPYCDTVYAEYINGCRRCYMGEVGMSTSVRLVDCVFDGKHWSRKATLVKEGTQS